MALAGLSIQSSSPGSASRRFPVRRMNLPLPENPGFKRRWPSPGQPAGQLEIRLDAAIHFLNQAANQLMEKRECPEHSPVLSGKAQPVLRSKDGN